MPAVSSRIVTRYHFSSYELVSRVCDDASPGTLPSTVAVPAQVGLLSRTKPSSIELSQSSSAALHASTLVPVVSEHASVPPPQVYEPSTQASPSLPSQP